MSNSEIIEWLKKKAEAVSMPGARKMYQAAAKALEAAEPEHTGKWLYQKGLIKCDQCLSAIRHIDHDGLLNFCPNCGAKMEVNHESN